MPMRDRAMFHILSAQGKQQSALAQRYSKVIGSCVVVSIWILTMELITGAADYSCICLVTCVVAISVTIALVEFISLHI